MGNGNGSSDERRSDSSRSTRTSSSSGGGGPGYLAQSLGGGGSLGLHKDSGGSTSTGATTISRGSTTLPDVDNEFRGGPYGQMIMPKRPPLAKANTVEGISAGSPMNPLQVQNKKKLGVRTQNPLPFHFNQAPWPHLPPLTGRDGRGLGAAGGGGGGEGGPGGAQRQRLPTSVRSFLENQR